jgi:hypothetical protein
MGLGKLDWTKWAAIEIGRVFGFAAFERGDLSRDNAIVVSTSKIPR